MTRAGIELPLFYTDRRGRSISVDKAKGEKVPGWCSYIYGGNHSTKMIRRQALPVRGAELEARRDLDRYAKRKGWHGVGIWSQ